MATTKIYPIKVNIHAVSKYIQDHLKTENGDLVSAFMCDENDVQKSFEKVLNNERSTHRKVIARHIIQSFKPGEVETDIAHQIGLKLAEEHLQGSYQYISKQRQPFVLKTFLIHFKKLLPSGYNIYLCIFRVFRDNLN